jgi:hypothetical protein
VRLALTRLSSGAHRTAAGYALVGCGKKSFAAEETNPGAKARIIPPALRGAEAPLFHGCIGRSVSADRRGKQGCHAHLKMWGRKCGDRRGVSRRVFFELAVMTVSSALFRHDDVFLQEHSAPGFQPGAYYGPGFAAFIPVMTASCIW